MNRIKKTIQKLFNRPSNPPALTKNWTEISIFIPKGGNCAVARTYELLHNFTGAGYEFHYINTLDAATSLVQAWKKKPVRVVILAHYWTDWTGLGTLPGLDLKIDWNLLLTGKRCQMMYGHICFGTEWLKNTTCTRWVSYNESISLFFGEEKSDQFLRNFLKKQLDITFKLSDSEEVYRQLKTLYEDAIHYLIENCPESAGCDILATALYSNLLALRHQT